MIELRGGETTSLGLILFFIIIGVLSISTGLCCFDNDDLAEKLVPPNCISYVFGKCLTRGLRACNHAFEL